jgi:CHAT domain-containing protein/tetratricopeptide (TPR) repeat protein
MPLFGKKRQQSSEELRQILAELKMPLRSTLDMPHRIDLCRRALDMVGRASQPQAWAALHNNLAISLLDNPLGDRAENLEQAIHHLNQALEVRTRAASPADWAMTLNNLATAYLYRIRGDQAENFEQAIHQLEQALEVRTRAAFPVQWAMTQHNLGIAYADRIRGGRADNLEQAIHHYQQALKVRTSQAFPADWAMTKNNLGVAYRKRIAGSRSDNLEQAIRHLEQALEVRTRAAFPEQWATTQSNLANAYYFRIRGERAENLEQAIRRYQQVLEVRARAAFPVDWAMTQNDLALAFADRIRGERADNLEHAIHHYRQALEVYSREALPEHWAMAQNNLAIAFADRIRGERAENLEQAIHHFQQALEVRTRAALPADWAMTQHNLATAYLYRIRGERAENLEQAIHHYQQVLEVRTRAALPADWAMTQHNLALAYYSRIRGERAENLEQAIHHYQQALGVHTRPAFPEQWAVAQNNLATAYRDRIRGDRAENLERAVHHYQQALGVYTREAFPADWAMTQNNLATVCYFRIQGDRAENLEQAIHHYLQALGVYSREAFPEQWAITQNDLATAYRDRIRGERSHNLEQAIHHYQQALEVRTRAALPSDHRQTLRNLGYLYFEERRWDEALEAYQAAIATGDDLLAAAYTEAGRRAEVGETSRLYSRAAYSLLQAGQPDAALLMYERGKTRLLVEALALADADLSLLPEAQQGQMRAAREAVRALEAEMRLPPDTPGRRDDRVLAKALREARISLNGLIDAIREDHLDFMPQGLDLPGLLALIPKDGVLVGPLVTSQGSAVFVVPHGTEEITEEHVIPLDELKEHELNALLRGTDGKSGWLHLLRRGPNELLRGLDRIIAELWDILLDPVHKRLQLLGVRSVILMPSGGLQLLPLHAAWRMENGTRRYFIDDYGVSYVPSGYALDASRRRAARHVGRVALVAGVNAYADSRVNPLVNAVPEARVLARLLEVDPLLDAAATKEAIKAGAAGCAFLHLSCHGFFAWGDPLASGLICHDEPLTLTDVIGAMNLDSARLVTLSACETGITDVRQSPDEYVGLPAGFLQAGAPAVVSTLWSVDDRSTALLMERFYRNHLELGMPLPAALREAQLWLRDATKQELGDYYKTFLRMTKPEALEAWMELDNRWKNPDDRPYAHPFYWAAFVFSGA